MESTFIAVGILSMVALVTLRQDLAGGRRRRHARDGGQVVVAVKDWTFVLGPGFVVGIGNG